MKFSIRFFLIAILLLSLAACNNDAATNENSDEKIKVKTSETKETKDTASTNITGYWKDKRGSYYSITKKDDTYSLNRIGVIELHLKSSKIEGNTINTTIIETPNTDHLSIPKEMIPDYLGPGKEVKFELSGNNDKLNFKLLGEPVTLTKVDNSNKVDPIDIVGNWMNDNDYFTITKDNNVITYSFEEEQEQLEISVEITDVVEDFVFGKVTKIIPEKFANVDDDLYLGSVAAFRLSDDKTKLSVMGDSELTKTDMSFEDFKAQVSNNE